jgi:hypothetical protein
MEIPSDIMTTLYEGMRPEYYYLPSVSYREFAPFASYSVVMQADYCEASMRKVDLD